MACYFFRRTGRSQNGIGGPPSPASGGWAGKSLILVRGSLRGNARHVYEVVDDNTYNMKIQFSPDAEGWNDVLTGVYRRAS